jgi:tripartite-type tricarboxylate transporter receptor subunit TctC
MHANPFLTFLLLAAAGGASVCAPAQTYPHKPLRFVVPFPPGGSADMLARLTGTRVGEAFGQQVVIDNRAGAGGNIAAEVTAHAAADGYTLLQANVAHAISASLYRKLNYDVLRDLTPVTELASIPFLLTIGPTVAAGSVRELIALARAHPGKLNYASSGSGGPSHLAMELFKSMAGVDISHIPYKGAAPALADLIAGQIEIIFSTPVAALPLVQAGKLKALAITSASRVAAIPDYPTIAEAGLPGYESGTWFGLMVPARTPQAVVDKLYAAFVAALRTKEAQERLAQQAFDIVGSTPAEFSAYLRAEIAKWDKVIKASHARVD